MRAVGSGDLHSCPALDLRSVSTRRGPVSSHKRTLDKCPVNSSQKRAVQHFTFALPGFASGQGSSVEILALCLSSLSIKKPLDSVSVPRVRMWTGTPMSQHSSLHSQKLVYNQ